jgi:hypothetical protein
MQKRKNKPYHDRKLPNHKGKLILPGFLFVLFGGTEVLTEGLVLYHLSRTPSPFCFSFFLIGSHVYAWVLILLFVLPQHSWMQVCHQAQPLMEIGSADVGLKLNPPNLCLLSS